MQENLSNYLKSAEKSIDVIPKSAQNVWSHPNCPKNSMNIILKSAQTSSNYYKSAKKSIHIIFKNAQKIFKAIIKVHENL